MASQIRWVRQGLLLALLIILASLAQYHIRQVVTASVLYDDAYNASVAKNLAMGFGYSTSYHELVPFNPEISTGPVLIVPAAVLMFMFGNQYWVPQLTIVLSIWTTLMAVLLCLRSYLGRLEWLAVTALISLGLLLLQVSAIELRLLGDVPSAFLASAAMLVLCRQRLETREVLGAGLLLGLALETKLYAALALPAMVTYLALAPRGPTGCSAWRRGLDAMIFLSGVLLPVAAREASQAAAIGFSLSTWRDAKSGQFDFIETHSGLGGMWQAESLSQFLMEKISHNARVLVESFDGGQAVTLFVAALAVSVGTLAATSTPDASFRRLRVLIFIQLAAAMTHLGWWMALDHEGWFRHLVPGTLYFLITVATAATVAFRRSVVVGSTSVSLLLLSWMGFYGNLGAVSEFNLRPEPRLMALLAVRNEIIDLLGHPDIVLVGYGWWVPRDLEYVLPTVGNFRDALRLSPSEMAGKRIVLVRNEFFNFESSADLSSFQEACDQDVVLRRDPFVVSRCPSLPGETPVPGGMVAGRVVAGEGFLDVANCTDISGWAWDREQPGIPVRVDVYDGDTLLHSAVASNFREDLLHAGVGDGRHGFRYVLPGQVKDSRALLIRVRISGTTIDLIGTPRSLVCGAPVPLPSTRPES